jgi:hypothetical protein
MSCGLSALPVRLTSGDALLVVFWGLPLQSAPAPALAGLLPGSSLWNGDVMQMGLKPFCCASRPLLQLARSLLSLSLPSLSLQGLGPEKLALSGPCPAAAAAAVTLFEFKLATDGPERCDRKLLFRLTERGLAPGLLLSRRLLTSKLSLACC